MRTFDLCGLGNALVDILLELGDAQFAALGFDRGTMRLVDHAEQTMRTGLAVSSHLSARHVDALRIKDSEWLFVEGYVLANPDTGQGAVREAVRLATAHGTKVALTCSEAFIVEAFGDAFLEA